MFESTLQRVALLTAIAALPGLAAAASPAALAVMDLRPISPAEAEPARLLSASLVEAVAAEQRGRVIGQQELAGMLEAAAFQQLTGCQDERCAADFSQSLAVDLLVTGQVGTLGKQRLVFLTLVDTRAHLVRARSSVAFAPDAPPRAQMRQAAKQLFDQRAEALGDRGLDSLRVALLFEEIDAEGKALRRPAVEGCVAKQLQKVGAQLISAAQLKKLAARTSARQLVDGELPDGLDSSAVDVILAGLVEYSPVVQPNTDLGVEVHNQRADLRLQLVNVDSAELVVAEQLNAASPGYTARAAALKAAERLCTKVTPALQRALGRRFERGNRVVVELQGVADAAAARSLGEQLVASSRASQARLRAFKDGSAQVDLVVPGGDGVRVALELAASPLGARVRETSPGRLVIGP